jgi:hypothetical protein
MITIVKLGPGNKEQTSVNTTLPVEALAALSGKSNVFRNRVKKVIISEEK